MTNLKMIFSSVAAAVTLFLGIGAALTYAVHGDLKIWTSLPYESAQKDCIFVNELRIRKGLEFLSLDEMERYRLSSDVGLRASKDWGRSAALVILCNDAVVFLDSVIAQRKLDNYIAERGTK